MLTQCWYNAGPPSATLAQHQTSTGVCWGGLRYLKIAIAHTNLYQCCVIKYQKTRPRQRDILSTVTLQSQDIGPRINQHCIEKYIGLTYGTFQTKMTKVFGRQTSPFNCETPLLFIYHYYKSLIMRFIPKLFGY